MKGAEIKELARDRRRPLLEEMQRLAQAGFGCQSCSGPCCTYVGNSMKVTPSETFELYSFLKDSGLWNQELELRLKNTVERFRLDSELSDGRRSFLRKTYTCPFYKDRSLGCSIAIEYKPFGCLGFNAGRVGEDSGDSCRSNLPLLSDHEKHLHENNLSAVFGDELGEISWEKLYLPVALLEFFKHYPAD